MSNNLKVRISSLILYINKTTKTIWQLISGVKNKSSSKSIERLELELLQYRKFINEPENYEEKVREENEIAEWLGQNSFTIKPLTPEEEQRLEYLLTIYNNNK